MHKKLSCTQKNKYIKVSISNLKAQLADNLSEDTRMQDAS